MKNVEKFPKGCRKVRPPALHPPLYHCSGSHIYTL